jgi:hypothetical protein
MLYLIALLLILVIIMLWQEQPPMLVSKYSSVINHDIVIALFEAMKRIENREDDDIQYLINQGKITKAMIEREADQILFELGEFPAESLCLDGRDFAKLVTIYDNDMRGATKEQVQWLLSSMFK